MSDFATLGMDVDSRGLTKGQRELRNLEKQAARTEKGVGKASALMSRGLVAVGVAAATLFSGGALVRGISQFEESMSRVGAVSRASGKDLRAMRKIALEMGSTTEFSASQAADGLNFLAMAGFDAQESIAALPQVLDLATASGLGLAQSADIASNVISGFGLAATDAAEVADTLAAASSRANTDVGQLGQAMSTVAPIAASLDISVQDTAAAIGVLSDAGIQGARAGTAMRGVLASLAGPTDQAREAIESYGLAVEDVNPETNSLAEIMGRLEEAGLTTADAMAIFGREAASGALALVDANERVGELTGQLEGAEGAAGDMADTMRDNLGGDIKGLMSALEGLILALGDAGLTAVLRATVQGITAFTRAVGAVIGRISEMQGYIIAAAAALTVTYAPALVGVATATWGVISANAVLVAGLITLRGALIATGIGALVVAAGFLINKFIELSRATGGFGNAISALAEIASLTASGMSDSFRSILPVWQAVVSGMEAAWLKMIQVIMRKWANVLRTMADALRHMPGMTAAFESVGLAAIDAGTKVHEIGVEIKAAQDASATFMQKAGANLANAFAPALARAAQLSALIKNMGNTSTSAPPDDGSRAGQMPNAVVPASPEIPEISIPSGGGVGGGGARDQLSILDQLLNGVTEQTPREKIEAWHEEVMTALNDANLKERGMLQKHNEYKLEIERLYQDQLRELQAQQQAQRLGEAADFFGSLQSLAQEGGEGAVKAAKVFGAAEALINTFIAQSQVLADPTLGFFGKLAAYAKIGAAGFGLVNAIKSSSTSSSGTPGGTAAAAAGGSEAAAPRIVLNVQPNERGDVPMETFTSTIDTINDELNLGGRIVA